MSVGATWQNLQNECEALAEDGTLLTPLSGKEFTITSIQEPRIVIRYRESGDSQPLQREQFETLIRRVEDTATGFELDRLPPDADPYAAVLSLHPRFEIDEQEGVIRATDESTGSQLVPATADEDDEPAERAEPDRPEYADLLLLVDAMERHDVDALDAMETPALVNLYTLLSDVQRGTDDMRKKVADILLERVHHDQPVHGQFGSVQRTSREYRSLKDDEEVLATLEDAGIDRERVTTVDSTKVDEALEVTEIPPEDVYDIDEREYVRKAEVDDEHKETRLQGLKDQLESTDDPEAEDLREEIEALESRIEELTEFSSGQKFHTPSGSDL
ncbi:hypothetical protein [Salinibaculum rarum]|uniref:hypothetical protein n=1 Tax=Salinibaculum rarum TaxID=3058903 RepID=UPI00265E226A|nr:hypothetical protein [Salinibaculum sp. KK48]